MKYLLHIALGISLAVGACTAEDKPELKDKKAKANYSVGYQIGSDFRRQDVDINPELLVQGMQDALRGEGTLMTAQEMRATLMDLQRRVGASGQQKTQVENRSEAPETATQ
jgi:FKBP-type peptidyl-prolyl cis-trans isomerase FklB